jgi:beta-lactamase superfamily II metal-dependent hydrolase
VGQANATLLEFSCGAVLIDAGAQDDDHIANLTDYLRSVFDSKPQLNNTLESIIITHNHIDHTRALRAVVEQFTVNRYIDNGQVTGTGTGNPNWVRKNAQTDGRNMTIREIMHTEVTNLPHKNGLTDSTIDPVNCSGTDPRVAVLSGQREENPGWSHEEFDNKNNHSIVIRVDFGEASFLFTGDMETDALNSLVEWYSDSDTNTLDVDVYHVGHHGSHNGTTTGLIEAMTPQIAVISMGLWNDGQGLTNRFNTWHYGHPRRVVVDMFTLSLISNRSAPVTVQVAEGSQNFHPYTVRRRIYGTGWDGTIKIRATADKTFIVTRNN